MSATKNKNDIEKLDLEELELEDEEELSNTEYPDDEDITNQSKRDTDATAFKKLKKKLNGSDSRISPIKAIRAKCLDCCCYQPKEVNLCPCEDCALWPFRFGKNPYSNRVLTEEQKAAMSERAKARFGKKK